MLMQSIIGDYCGEKIGAEVAAAQDQFWSRAASDLNGSRDQRLQLPVIGVERLSIAFATLAFKRGLPAIALDVHL